MSPATCKRCGVEGVELSEGICGDCWAARAADADAARAIGIVGNLLGRVTEELRRYVVLGDVETRALALYVLHTWAFEAAHATPYLLVLSPERRSGKTRLLEVLELLCARPWRVVGASEAAIFRKLAADRPTLLLDEIDAIFGSNSERTEPLRAILNAGNRAGASVARCVGDKGDQVRDFPIFSPKVLAGIDTGRLPDTIRDRAITIAMKRRTAGEDVHRLRWRKAEAAVAGLRGDLERWAEGAAERLEDAEPTLPDELDDRAAEAWEPLFAIANEAGGDWPALARRAAVQLSGGEEVEEASRGAQLLAAIRDAMEGRDRIPTRDLLDTINADEGMPFGAWRDGKGLDGRTLAKLLRPYGVKRRKLREGDDTYWGYARADLADAWARWLPTPPTEGEQGERREHAPEQGTQTPLEQAIVPDVPDVPAISGGGATEGNPDGNGQVSDAEYLRRFQRRREGVAS